MCLFHIKIYLVLVVRKLSFGARDQQTQKHIREVLKTHAQFQEVTFITGLCSLTGFFSRFRRQVFSWCGQFYMDFDATKPVRSFRRSKTQTSLPSYREWLKIDISLVASLDMVLSRTRITKAPPSLCGRAGWSALLYFANTEHRFSHVEAH